MLESRAFRVLCSRGLSLSMSPAVGAKIEERARRYAARFGEISEELMKTGEENGFDFISGGGVYDVLELGVGAYLGSSPLWHRGAGVLP